jgi:RHS repeat-associated protein
MISKSFRSRIVGSIVGGLALILFLLVLADWMLPAAKAKKFQYDKNGRLISRTTPNGRIVKYAYDKAGLLKGISYHRIGTITKVSYPAGDSVKYDYDPAGNRTAMNDRRGNTRYSYDEYSRLTQITHPGGASLSYQYDPWNQVKSITFPDGYKLSYQYDLMRHVTQVGDGKALVRYKYSGQSNQTLRRLPNGVTTLYQFSPLGQLTLLKHSRPDDTVISAFHYQYDPKGRITQSEETTPHGQTEITAYEYDSDGRLIKAVLPGNSSITYEYDHMGNRISQTDANGTIRYEYDQRGWLAKAGSTSFTYDNAGNILSKKENGQSTTYQYDDENRLLEVRTGKNTIRYTYDGNGNRVRRDVNGRVQNFLNGNNLGLPQVAAEYGKADQMSHYLIGESRVGRRSPNGDTVYFLEDHLGSTRCVVDTQGKLLARYSYSPFGESKLVEGTAQTDWLFAGESWDPDAQLLYLRTRYYDPRLGRFLSPDMLPASIADPATFNQYVYVSNDPVNQIDPLGLQRMPPPFRPPQFDRNEELKLIDRLLNDWRNPPPASTEPLDQYRNRQFDYVITHSAGTGVGRYLDEYGISSRNPIINLGGAAYSNGINQRVRGDPVPTLLNFLGLGDSRAEYLPASGRGVNRHDFSANYLPLLSSIPPDKSVLVIFGINTTQTDAENTIRDIVATGRLPKDTVAVAPFGKGFFSDLWSALTTFQDADPDRRRFDFFPERGWDDNGERYAPFPPGGGGGGAAPNVGGVYLDQTAKVIGDLGPIVGVAYDQKTNQLILIGNRNINLPAMKPEYLAAAIRVVYSESKHEPGMTIDPHPQDPHGPIMNVIFFGSTENTRLGWVMFEADRVMKGYSVGNDNISKQPVVSSVPGYQSVGAMSLQNGNHNSGLWSRFWLVPQPVIAKLSDDGNTILFEPIKMQVKTETMRWDGGKLVSAGGIKDAEAETFASHFTQQYEDFARENPIYTELKHVTQAVALAQWMRQKDLPVEWNYIRHFAGQPYQTPTTTPSAFADYFETINTGLRKTTLKIHSFGGVEMSPQIRAQRDREAEGFHRQVINGWTAAQKEGKMSFGFAFNNVEFQAVALPSTNDREVAAYRTAAGEIRDCFNAAKGELLPGMTRYYNSSHNEATEFGFGWSLLLPRLEFEVAKVDGNLQYLSVANNDASRVLVQKFVLTNQFGIGEVRFEEGSVDQALGRIGFKPKVQSNVYRGIYPEPDGSYRLIFNGEQQAIFDPKGNLRAILKPDSKALYDYDHNNRMIAIRLVRGNNEKQLSFTFDAENRIASVASGERQVTYSYDGQGNLTSMQSNGRLTAYQYNDKRILTNVVRDGVATVNNTYDDFGRLRKQTDAVGNEREQELATSSQGKVVTVKDASGTIRKHYDRQYRLVSAEGAGGQTYTYQYDDTGRISGLEFSLLNGAKGKAEISTDKKEISTQDPRGVSTKYRLNDKHELAEVVVNNRRAVLYDYDDEGRLTSASYEDGSTETYTRNADGRVREYRRDTKESDGTVSSQVVLVEYDSQGELVKLVNQSVGEIQVMKTPGSVTVTQGSSSFVYQFDDHKRLIKVAGPDRFLLHCDYGANGLLTRVFLSQADRGSQFEFSERVTAIKDWNGKNTTYTDNDSGLLGSVQASDGTITSYSYDNQNRLRRVDFPNGRCLQYLYNSASNLIEERSGVCQRKQGE